MATGDFTSDWTSIPTDVGENGCLTSNTTHLFVVGGTNQSDNDTLASLDTVQIIGIDTKQWSNGPTMLTPRAYLSCIVHPSDLSIIYAIGGDTGTDVLSSIEAINVVQSTSEYVDSLTTTASDTRAVIFEESIYIIGGLDIDAGWRYLNTVHVLNTDTGTVSLLPDSLPYTVASASVVAVNNVIYCFGGQKYSGHDTWMKYQMYVFVCTNM